MSINHFPSDLPEALWWAQYHHQQHNMMESSTRTPSSKHNISNTTTATSFCTNSQVLYHHRPMSYTQNSAFGFDLNNEEDEENEEQLTDERESTLVKEEPEVHYNKDREIPKQALFEKPLTPSDVGKLNRLVIPKQHAEKYFPLNGNDSGEKGLLLSFEDELGKPWRFRYSYWNSSQSYVLTKGWSRFVKEKRLDAGDIVLFERHRLDGDRLFIGWRRRSLASNPGPDSGAVAQAQTPSTVAGGGGGSGWTRLFFPGHPYQAQPHGHGPALPYQPDCLHAASVLQSQTTPSANANSKKLRLFGVNLDLGCQQDDSEQPTPEDGSSVSSQGQAQYQYHYYTDPKLHAYNHQNHMDINFSRDGNQRRYHQG